MTTNAIDVHSNSAVGAINQGSGTLNIGNMFLNAEAPPQDNFDLPSLIDTFTGRDKEMKKLHSLFFNKDKKEIRNKVVICGFGGIGKSELAKQFARKCKDDGKIQESYWIHAEFEDQLKNSATKIKDIYNKTKGKKCLFILDNGISRKKLAECDFELSDDAFYIITSQQKQWGSDFESIQLDSLDIEVAVNFYKTYLKEDYNDEDCELFKKLAKFVECTPLGLQLTAAYAYQTKLIHGETYLQTYIKELEESHNDIIEIELPSIANNSYKKSILGAITVSLDKIANNKDTKYSDLALSAVYVSSYLNPERIYCSKLQEILNNVEEVGKNKDKLKAALYVLDNLSLVSNSSDGTSIKMHRLVQEVLRYHLRQHDPAKQEKYYMACLECSYADGYFTGSVLQYADEIITVFNNFYIKFKYLTCYNKVFPDMCFGLIHYKCIKSLEIILKDLGVSAQEYIIKYSLFNFAATRCNETNILGLFLKYVDVNNKDNYHKNTPLHSAASSCNIKAIEFLLDHGADINSRNEEGNTPLFEFFRNVSEFKHIGLNEVDTVFQLLKFDEHKILTNYSGKTYLHVVRNKYLAEYLITKYQVNVNAQDNRQRTPLHTVLNESVSHYINVLIKVLIIHGALLNIKDCNGMTPIAMVQSNKNETSIIELFFEDRFTDQLRKVFNELGDQNVIEIINESNFLHRAMEDNQIDVLNLLLEYDINIDTKLIFFFLNGRYIEQLRKVFKKFGDQNVINIVNGSKLLHRAIDGNQTDILNLLLEYDIDVNIKDYKLRTPLHTAMDSWNSNVIKILVRRGADFRPRCNLDYTPLHYFFNGARNRKHINLNEVNEVLELLQYECDDNENAMSKYKQTLLHVAAMSCHADLVDILAGKYKLNVNALDINGDTPLHFLIAVLPYRTLFKNECDVIKTIQVLTAHGARRDIKNNEGFTPFEIAKQIRAKFLPQYEKRRKYKLVLMGIICILVVVYYNS